MSGSRTNVILARFSVEPGRNQFIQKVGSQSKVLSIWLERKPGWTTAPEDRIWTAPTYVTTRAV